MKRLIGLFLVLCFSAQVFAGSVSSIERSLDEYQYALTVEWDQKDQTFYNKKTQEFFAEVGEIMAQEGLTREQVLLVAEKKMKNKAQFEALKMKLTLAGTAGSSTELAKIIQESAKDMYSQGASWNGEAILPVLGGLALAAIIGYAVWFSVTHECIAWDERWSCSSDSYCDGYGYCSSSDVCGWDTYCTRYQKKK